MGYELAFDGVWYCLLFVTMLYGRFYEDVARLVASVTIVEAFGGARGDFIFMTAADVVRGVFDSSYDIIMERLRARGFE